MLWCYAAGLRAYKGSGSCLDEFVLGIVLGGFHPNGVAVNMVEDHLVLKTSAGDMWKLTGSVSVKCVSCVVGFHVYVMLLWEGCW